MKRSAPSPAPAVVRLLPAEWLPAPTFFDVLAQYPVLMEISVHLRPDDLYSLTDACPAAGKQVNERLRLATKKQSHRLQRLVWRDQSTDISREIAPFTLCRPSLAQDAVIADMWEHRDLLRSYFLQVEPRRDWASQFVRFTEDMYVTIYRRYGYVFPLLLKNFCATHDYGVVADALEAARHGEEWRDFSHATDAAGLEGVINLPITALDFAVRDNYVLHAVEGGGKWDDSECQKGHYVTIEWPVEKRSPLKPRRLFHH